MLPSPSDLLYFIEVANTLNLSRAAERLGISQPSLSNAIVRLEEVVGINLLIRHKRGVYLTQAGKQFVNHARQLLQQWEELKAQTVASHHQVQGHYTLGCHPSIAKYTLPYFLPQLIKNYPDLEIHLKHDISRKVTEEIISLSLDIAIVVNPVRHPDLVIYKLFNDGFTLWHNPETLTHHTNAPLICDLELSQSQILLKQLKKQAFKFNRMITSSSLDVIAALTASGCGIGMLPERVVKSTYPHQLIRLPKSPICHDEICIVYRHENRNVLAIQTIISEIKKLIVL